MMTLTLVVDSKVAFVLGGANTFHYDLGVAYSLATPDTIIACNNAGFDWPHPLPHWCTHHTEKMPQWINQRKENGFPDASSYWTSNQKTIPPEHEHLYNHIEKWDGSSGLLCVSVALHLGYDKVFLCGVPLDKFANHYDNDQTWDEASKYRGAWMRRMPQMQGKVKSPSGWTKLKLGEPTRKWVESKTATN